jgi:catechol 2,3-dioxygenase-like lactoylglutathione lyase family enzyme/predicted enzyme related to lactoylglutathione lyase
MKITTIFIFLLLMSTLSNGQSVKLGSSARIAVSSNNIPASYEFYKKFGFKPIDGSNPDISSSTSFLRLTDGQIILTLLKETFKSPILAYFADDLTSIAPVITKHVPDAEVTTDETGINEIIFKAPGGLTIDIHRDRKNHSLKPSGTENPACGTFGELTLGVGNRDSAITFFKHFGFEPTGTYNMPYPWAIAKDGNIVLGIHQNPDLQGAFITYFSSKAEAQIQALVKAGIPIVKEIPDGTGKTHNATFLSPDGVYFNIFYFAGKL